MNYSTVVSTSLAYSDRKDQDTANMIDLFIAIVESRINRVLHIEDMSTRYQFPNPNPADGRYPLPIDFSKMQDICIVNVQTPTSRQTLSLLNPEQMNNATNTTNIDNINKLFYNIIASDIVVQRPLVDGTDILEICYYANIKPLTSSNTTNWISLNHPDLYVFGILVEINSYAKDPTATQLWNTRFEEVVNELASADEALVYSGTPLVTRVG
jgi:hypothetical protein